MCQNKTSRFLPRIKEHLYDFRGENHLEDTHTEKQRKKDRKFNHLKCLKSILQIPHEYCRNIEPSHTTLKVFLTYN